jgi:uncharacterized protein GlcG (DUF336 family)
MLKVMRLLSAFAALALFGPAGYAQLADKKVLNLDGAKKIAAAAEAEAVKNKWNVVIAVVDDGGHLLYLQRMDGTQTGSIDVAIGKARTAMAFKRPTKVFDELAKTRPSIVTLGEATLLEGGVPVKIGDQVVGAVGVSGVTSVQDAQIADAGIAALGLQ